MVEQLQRIAEKHPDRYKNPLTGEIMVDRIESDIRTAASKYTPEALIDTLLAKPSTDSALNAIAEKTSKPSSVVASMETEKEPEPIPKDVRRTMEVLGFDSWEEPPQQWSNK